MESLTRPQVQHEWVRQIAELHLGDAPAEIDEVMDGWFSCIFRLAMPSGEQAMLKIAPAQDIRLLRYEAKAMTTEVQSMRLIRERSHVPVPKILAHDISHQILPHDFFIMETLPGIDLEKVMDSLEAGKLESVDRQVGGHLKEIHEIHGEGFGQFGGPFFPTMPDAYRALVHNLALDAQDFNVEGVDTAIALANANANGFVSVTTPSLVHWDLNDANVLIDPETCEVSGYIDFERALWSDPLAEYNFLWPRPGFLEAYGLDMSEPGVKARRNLWELYLGLVWVIECYSRKFPADHLAWARRKLGEAISIFA